MIIPRKTKAGRTRYLVRVNNRTVGTYGTRQEAVVAEGKAIEAGAPTTDTIRGLYNAWMAEQDALVERGDRSPGTPAKHRTDLRAFLADHGPRKAALFTTAEARAAAASMSRNQLLSVRALFNYGLATERITSNPFDPAKVKRTTKGKATKIRPGRGALTLAELDQLAAIAASSGPGLHLDAMVRFSAWSCVRQGELFLASPAGLDGDGLWVSEQFRSRYANGQQRALPKDREVRRIHLVPEARAAIAHVDAAAPFLFTNSRGDHWRASSLAYQWKAVQLAFTASLPEGHWIAQRVRWAQEHGERGGHFTWHELRHTGATQFLLDGVSHEAVARQLGHATAEYVLETYGHVSEWDAAQEFQRIYEQPVGDLTERRQRRAA